MNLQESLHNLKLPARVSDGLAGFCDALSSALGNELICITLYGSALSGEFYEETSDVNVLIMVRQANIEVLNRALDPIQRGVREFRLAPFLLAEEDLRQAANVFPIKFGEIKERYRVLMGPDCIEPTVVNEANVRARCQAQLINLTLRLRQLYLQRGDRLEMIERTLTDSISQFVTTLRAMLKLKNLPAPQKKPEIIQHAAREFQLDGSTLQQSLELKRGATEADRPQLEALYQRYMEVVREASKHV